MSSKRGLMLALVLLAALTLTNFDQVNDASTAPPGIKDGAYMWYETVDFTQSNKTDYTYVEFEAVHEYTAEILIRTALLSSNGSDWSEHPPLYGHLDFESGYVALVGATGVAVPSFWASPQNAQTNATSGFAPDSKNYGSIECWTLESKTHGERWWYDKVTGVLIQTSFLSGNQTTKIVILYETNIPVGKGLANQWFMSLETPVSTMTYAAVLIGIIAVVALAVFGLVRSRKKKKKPEAPSAKRCPSCGHANRDDAVFCSHCGSSLAARGTPVTKPEPLVSEAPVIKPEPAAGAVILPRELERTTAGPVETRNVCRTCGHVNPEWVRNYCVRCAAKL
jgi:ribosomal protein L32